MNNKVILYTINCPKCRILETKLKQKNVNFEIIDNVDEVVEFGKSHNIMGAPILDVDDEAMDFNAAIKWVNGR